MPAGTESNRNRMTEGIIVRKDYRLRFAKMASPIVAVEEDFEDL
jgi:hypothetical protein